MTKNEIKLATLDSMIGTLELTQKLVCLGCAKSVPMANDVVHANVTGNTAVVVSSYSECGAKDLRALVDYIRSVMLKIPRE